MLAPGAEPVVVARGGGASRFACVGLSAATDGSYWLAWVADDRDGPEGSVRAMRLDPNGRRDSPEAIAARGSRGGFVLGDVASVQGGGCAIGWRGEEGLAWVARLNAKARAEGSHYLEPCVGRPALVALPIGDALVALAHADGPRVSVVRVSAAGPDSEWCRGAAPSDQPALTLHGGTIAAAWREGSTLVVMHGSDRTPLVQPNPRMVPHVPAIAATADARFVAWIAEDTGKLWLFAARVGAEPARIAEVWCRLDGTESSAPALVALEGGGLAVACRQERGPRPAVYLRWLDGDARPSGDEVRLNARETSAAPGRIGLVASPAGVACAWIESGDDGDTIMVRVVGR